MSVERKLRDLLQQSKATANQHHKLKNRNNSWRHDMTKYTTTSQNNKIQTTNSPRFVKSDSEVTRCRSELLLDSIGTIRVTALVYDILLLTDESLSCLDIREGLQ